MKHIGIYPGSFDPITMGHVNIVERTASCFDKIIIAVADNLSKNHIFKTEERVKLIEETFAHRQNITVTTFKGLLVDFVKTHPNAVLIRGIRTVSDFEYELRMAQANRKMHPAVETFFMATAPEYSFVSSTLIREIIKLGGPLDQMVPEAVMNALKRQTP